MPNKLHFYTKYSKEKIKISDKAFASGGEGALYAIASPRHYHHLVAKIYYPEKRTKDREAKMHYLMQHPPIRFQKGQAPSIGWVQDVIYKEQRFLGILLIRIEGEKLTKLTLAKLPRRAAKAWQRFAFQDPDSIKLRLRTCFNLAVVIYQIHEKGQYVLVDLKPDNILMQPNGLLAIVDMDSVEVIENGKAIFAAPVATPEYTPPEHYIGERTVIEETWDRFSLGVIFYQLLLGLHPFTAMSHPPYDNLVSIHDKIQHDLYVHHPDKAEFFKVIPPPHKRFESLPLRIQELFHNCFTFGADKPFSRPSALDWCAALAYLLNLPFRRIPDYDLPYEDLPKIDFQPSALYFEPELDNLQELYNLDINATQNRRNYRPYSIDSIDLEEIKPLMTSPIETLSVAKITQTEQKKLLGAMQISYKDYLKEHRNNLWVVIRILVPLSILCFSFPWLTILGMILLFFALPKLMFRSSKEIIHSIGKVVLPTSTEGILSKQDAFLASDQQLHSSFQALKTKRAASIKAFNQLSKKAKEGAVQHLEKMARTKELLPLIRQKRNLRQSFIDPIASFDPWVEYELKVQLAETRQRERKAYAELYKVFSRQFKAQLQEKKGVIRNTFRDFSNKKFKLEKSIVLQKNKLPTIVDEAVKAQMLKDYNKALEENELHFATQLEAYQAENQKLLPEEIEFSEPQKKLEQNLKIHLKYSKRKKQSALKKAKRILGKNFQVNLKQYIDLLYNSGPTTDLHFAHNNIQKQLKKFQEEISTLNLNKKFQDKLSSLFITESQSERVLIPQSSTSNLIQLEKEQVMMADEWLVIEKELQLVEDKIAQLQFESLNKLNHTPTNLVLNEIRDSIDKIKYSEEIYHNIQKSFYNNPQIAQLHKVLKSYRETELIEQSLERDFLHKITLLNKVKKPSEERKRLNQALKNYEQDSIKKVAKKAEEITLLYEQSLAELEREWKEETNNIQKKLKEDTAALAQLNLDIKSFEEDISITVLDAEQAYPKALEKTRLEFDAIYKDYKTTYNQKYKTLKENYSLLKKNETDLADLIQTHRKNHLKNSEYPFIHLTNLNALETIENEIKTLDNEIAAAEQKIESSTTEKIKIETLLKWQEDYSTKIYIKDLLLNKIEQFREAEN